MQPNSTTMKKYLIFLLLPLFLSCKKEILIDYHEVEPLYVAEATLTQTGTNVRLSTTQNVTDNNPHSHIVENAIVVLSCKNYELKDTLHYTREGYYKSETVGSPGFSYDLDIYVNDRHFTSSSTMQEVPVVKSYRFVWQKMVSTRILYCDLRIQDDPDRDNYYLINFYRNNESYRWSVMNDVYNKGGELQKLIACSTERKMDENDSDALQENDSIRIEVRAIDQTSYDYFYSMQVMKSAGTNPLPNFTGGCLGYFSAYNYVILQSIFHRSQVEEK